MPCVNLDTAPGTERLNPPQDVSELKQPRFDRLFILGFEVF